MVSNPSDRDQAILGITSALVISVVALYFSPSTDEAIMIVDFDPDKNARLMMVVMSSGTFSGGSMIDLLEMADMTQAMKDSGALIGSYKQPQVKNMLRRNVLVFRLPIFKPCFISLASWVKRFYFSD